MPSLISMSSAAPIKAIIAADSGAGKTGALWSLAAAGFKLKIFDADKGTPILASILKDKPEALANIEVNSFTNFMERDPITGYMKPKGAPKAWPNLMDALNKWPDDPEKKGITSWGWDTVAVFDSLTMFGRHALIYAQHLEGKSRWKPELQHYGTAMAQIEALFATLYGDDVKCHVLFLTHVKVERDEEERFLGAYPSSLGKALNGVIPRYVNDILTVKISGSGPTAKRFLSTKPTANQMATKTRELSVRDEYLLAEGRTPKPGLAEYFADCGWDGPGQ